MSMPLWLVKVKQNIYRQVTWTDRTGRGKDSSVLLHPTHTKGVLKRFWKDKLPYLVNFKMLLMVSTGVVASRGDKRIVETKILKCFWRYRFIPLTHRHKFILWDWVLPCVKWTVWYLLFAIVYPYRCLISFVSMWTEKFKWLNKPINNFGHIRRRGKREGKGNLSQYFSSKSRII